MEEADYSKRSHLWWWGTKLYCILICVFYVYVLNKNLKKEEESTIIRIPLKLQVARRLQLVHWSPQENDCGVKVRMVKETNISFIPIQTLLGTSLHDTDSITHKQKCGMEYPLRKAYLYCIQLLSLIFLCSSVQGKGRLFKCVSAYQCSGQKAKCIFFADGYKS